MISERRRTTQLLKYYCDLLVAICKSFSEKMIQSHSSRTCPGLGVGGTIWEQEIEGWGSLQTKKKCNQVLLLETMRNGGAFIWLSGLGPRIWHHNLLLLGWLNCNNLGRLVGEQFFAVHVDTPRWIDHHHHEDCTAAPVRVRSPGGDSGRV